MAVGARSRRAIAAYEQGLARIEDRWSGQHPRPVRLDISNSLYAADLDLFSPGGLFELLCTTRTSLGEDTLAAWLLAPATLDEVRARQQAVVDLRERIGLREDLWSAPGTETIALDAAGLTRWATRPQADLPKSLHVIAPSLALLFLVAFLWWLLSHSLVPLLLVAAVNGGLTYALERRLKPLFGEAQTAAKSMAALAPVAAAWEREAFRAPKLQSLQATLHVTHQGGSRPASHGMRRLARLAAAAALRGHLLTRLLDVSVLYSLQLCLALQRWRKTHAAELPTWLASLGELEGSLSLSAYSFEHPDDPFPELTTQESTFRAEALGHPLLPAATCVRNNVILDAGTRLLLISGSNMSGKSTLLRSVGVATVMALAGAPVRAQSLHLSGFHLAGSILVNDSLQSGRSRFYAEILRLRAVCALARSHPPVLFLLDELLAGTNSHDRVAGATGIVKALLRAGASGLLSTHDLALTTFSGVEATLIHNAHFEDQVAEGTLHFDYLLREGVVTRSNGIALMRMIGLDV